MNKLVSKNPVLRFKLGNRIVKFQQSGKIYASRPREVHGAEVNGERVGYVEIPGKGYIAISPSGKAYNYNGNGAVGQLNFKPINLSNYDLYHILRAAQTPGKITGFTSRDASAVANYWVNKKPSYLRTSSKIVVNKLEKTPTTQDKPAVVANRAATGYTLPEGVTSVADTQTMLKNAGFDLGKYGVDGVWGKDTLAAYDAWKNKLAANVGGTTGTTPNVTYTPTNTETTVSGNGYRFTLPTNTNTSIYESYYPGTYSNLNNMFTRKEIRNNRGTNYSNVNEYWDWLQNNKNSEDYKVWSNIMGNDGYLNKEIFDNVMSQYGISGNLGRRDSGRLSNLLNDLNLIGVKGSDARKAFLTNFDRNLPSSEEINEYVRTNTPARPNLSTINWGTTPSTISSNNPFGFSKSEFPHLFAKNGGLISKNPIKRFKNGGIQKFLKAGNLPTAPKAEDRYRGGLRVSVETKGGRYGGNDRMEIKEVLGKKPGMFGSVPFIRLTVVHSSVSPDYNDTTYIEVPERKNFLVLRKLRGVEKHPSIFRTYYSKVYPFYGSILPDLGSGSKLEYETLKQRFNTAWNIAK